MGVHAVAVLTVAIGFLFAFVNGFHDGCNVIATIVASGSMRPAPAVALACLAEFVGPIVLGTAVAATMGKDIISQRSLTGSGDAIIPALMLLSALAGGILWNLVTWRLAIPSSSSHALVGGLLGVGIFGFGVEAVNWHAVLVKVFLVLLTSPIIGFVAGYVFMRLSLLLFAGLHPRAGKVFKRIQLLSMVFLGLSHGSNDAQKSMGVITILLVVTGHERSFDPPLWVVLGCAASISLGLSMGGWKIIRTVGARICKLRPLHSFNSQLAASSVIFVASLAGGPVSTTQIVGSSVMGVGAARRLGAVRWIVVRDILFAWFITIPAAGALSVGIYYPLVRLLVG